MIHFVFLVAFCGAVGLVLAAILRRGIRRVLRLAAWITGGLVFSAVVLGWILYIFPL